MRPKEVTDFLRCGGMNCDCSCERYPNTIGDCMTGRIHDYVIQLEQRGGDAAGDAVACNHCDQESWRGNQNCNWKQSALDSTQVLH